MPIKQDTQTKKEINKEKKRKFLHAFCYGKELMVRFGHSNRRCLTTKGSIAIEGAMCITAALMLLGVLYNLSLIYIGILHANRMVGDAARGLINAQNITSGVIQNMLDDIVMEDALDNGSTVQVTVTQVSPYTGNMSTYYGGGGCAGPGGQGSSWILSNLTSGFTSVGGNSSVVGAPQALAFAQINACVPLPTISWMGLGSIPIKNVTAHAVVVIPKLSETQKE